MKKTIVILAMCLLGALTVNAQTKIGTVSLKKIFEGYWKTKQAESQLKERGAEFDKQNAEMVTDYKAKGEEYKKVLDSANDQTVTVEEREKRKKAAESKLLEIKEIETNMSQFERSARTTLGEQQRRMRDNILKEIQAVVDVKAKTGSFTIVIDVSSEGYNSNYPFVVYTNGENDFTDDILKQLNANAPAEIVKPVEDKPKAIETIKPDAKAPEKKRP